MQSGDKIVVKGGRRVCLNSLGLWGTREDGGRGDIQPGPQDQHTPSYPSTNRTRTPGWLSEPLRVQRPRSEHSMTIPSLRAQHRPSELAGMTTSARQRTSSYGRKSRCRARFCDSQARVMIVSGFTKSPPLPVWIEGLCSIGRAGNGKPSPRAQCDLTPARHDLSYARPQLSLPWPCPCPQFPAVSVPNSAQASESQLREGPGSREKRETGRWRRRHGGGEMEREESGKEEGKVWWLKQREEQDSTLYSCSAHAQARRGRQVHHARTGLAEQD
ncbi:hypothetical protein CIHG_03629 [Coccidioides immitis H538.4]|uniref:Uncharacterized protein n=1 Tax=Coccidioides immitis H538.4 TaxID=396776 RepID=A0A0J8UE42_COCIT|nr:hypothetical protein CIHG_03629 [Coccidioides immitis H538.4]